MPGSNPSELGRYREAKKALRSAAKRLGYIHASDLGGENMLDVQDMREQMLDMALDMEQWEEQAKKDDAN